jgi:hypothetical protein
MKRTGMMPLNANTNGMWTLSADRHSVRLALPPLQMADAESLKVVIDFGATTVDEIINRLTMLRSQMLPPPSRN